MAKNKTLSLRVQWLGERLRKARLEAGYTLEEAGEYLQIKHNTLSRFENGVYRAKPSYVRDLVDFYGISNERERAVLLQLNEDAWRKDWFLGNADDLDREFIDYTWLEARADVVHVFEPMLIPGLLHIPTYAAALASAGLGPNVHPDDIARTAEVRATRQKILEGDHPTKLSVVLEEAALFRQIGERSTQQEQLKHLITAGKRPNIEVRILPRRSGWHPGLDGPFTFFDMPDPYPDVAYIENLVGRAFLEDEKKVERYRHAYHDLYEAASSLKQSAAYIQTIMKELE